jgi:hypothetical protein
LRFYFDIDDGISFQRDDMGTELPTEADARKAAIEVLPRVAKELLPNGAEHNFIVVVRNERNENIFKAKLALTSEWATGHPVT